jgi:hypothetical protein
MVTTTIRVASATRDKLRVLAEQESRTIGDIVAAAVDRYEEEAFWAEAHRTYAAMRADPAESAAFDAEVAAWDGTLKDRLEGLEGDRWDE